MQFRLAVGKIGLPDDPAVFLVGGDHARRMIRDRDDQATPQRCAAIRRDDLLLPRVHAPHDAACLPGPCIDLVEHAPLVGDVEEAILGERRRFEVLVRRGAADRYRVSELEILHVAFVDLVQRRIALCVVGAVVHQPVLRLAGVTSAASAGDAAISTPASIDAVVRRFMSSSQCARLRERTDLICPQKSGLSAVGTAASCPGNHWVFSAQTCSAHSTNGRP